MLIEVNETELATILAGLRAYQWIRDGTIKECWEGGRLDMEEIASNGGTHEQLDGPGVERLCERLNCSEMCGKDVKQFDVPYASARRVVDRCLELRGL